MIDRFPVAVAFHGHAHHGTAAGRTRGGVPVFNCSEALMKQQQPDQPFAVFEVDADSVPDAPPPVTDRGA